MYQGNSILIQALTTGPGCPIIQSIRIIPEVEGTSFRGLARAPFNFLKEFLSEIFASPLVVLALQNRNHPRHERRKLSVI